MQTAPINVGIVGAGLSATTFHVPLIQASPVLNISRVLRSSSTRAVPGLEQVPVFTDLQAFLQEPPSPELVVITTPTHTHHSLAKACIAAGKHVVLEKPMAATFSEAQELCQMARDQNTLLAVYHNRRWDGDFLTAKALIKCGALGRLVEFESHFDRFRPGTKPGWKEDPGLPGAGILYDLGSHLIGQALCLFGTPVRLTGLIQNQRQLPSAPIHDAFMVTLHYDAEDGPLTVLLRASMLTKIAGPRFILHGTQGSWIKHGLDVQEGQLRAGHSPLHSGFGVEGSDSYGLLDSQALDLSLAQLPAATEGLQNRSLASSTSAAGAEAPAGPQHEQPAELGPRAAKADVAAIVAGVLARQDAGASGSGAVDGGGRGKDTRVRVVTEQGCWQKFYDEVAGILLPVLGKDGQGQQQEEGQQQKQQQAGRSGAAAVVMATAVGLDGSGSSVTTSSSSANINSWLSVQPEVAAEVIRLIELAMQSSNEGRTLPVTAQQR